MSIHVCDMCVNIYVHACTGPTTERVSEGDRTKTPPNCADPQVGSGSQTGSSTIQALPTGTESSPYALPSTPDTASRGVPTILPLQILPGSGPGPAPGNYIPLTAGALPKLYRYGPCASLPITCLPPLPALTTRMPLRTKGHLTFRGGSDLPKPQPFEHWGLSTQARHLGMFQKESLERGADRFWVLSHSQPHIFSPGTMSPSGELTMSIPHPQGL